MPTPPESTDYYAVLKVNRQASLLTIKQSYRKLARQLHPDLNPNDVAAAEQFKALNEAYEVLSDPAKRRQYDRYGAQWKKAEKGYASTSHPSNRQNDDFDEMEFGRFGRFEDLLGDLLDRYS
ncbi:DnaJ domain-containing protein [Leptolyngbya sp. CCNP1308]|uniref:DnaJ domain-containing protein n=1 Tax=Leptolyngbya sp. CCNP1308 TaxID=3110255 RepID=UPI002B2150F2|nr:DnaJ domain-containing protein [Leptolyngbya sp. CCNP1308]MEA5450898.1 DnaJ domain-containing protein [Leptolyngbya sp. CCNP1308]